MINIGGDKEVSIRELAERVIRLAGSGSKIRLVPYDQVYGRDFEDLPRRLPDIARIGRLVGWKPGRSLDEMIAEVIEYCRRSPEA